MRHIDPMPLILKALPPPLASSRFQVTSITFCRDRRYSLTIATYANLVAPHDGEAAGGSPC
jgi:hypothetical protein